jgi:hypothetical protein
MLELTSQVGSFECICGGAGALLVCGVCSPMHCVETVRHHKHPDTRHTGAPVPPPAVISRAIAVQGATCVLAGMWGTSSGTTA